MPVRTPVTVTLTTNGYTRTITRDLLEDLQWGSTAPGGYTTLTCSLSRPIDRDVTELTPYTIVEAWDSRSGENLFHGRLEDPGRGSKKVWALQAVGGSAHAVDLTLPVVYIDTRLDKWTQYEKKTFPSGAVASNGDTGDPDSQTLHLSFPKGYAVTNGSRVVVRYDLLRSTGQYLGRLSCEHREGLTGANWNVEFVGRGGPGAESVLDSQTWTTGWVTLASRRGVDWPASPTGDHRAAELRMHQPTGTGTTGETQWTEVRNLSVKPTRLDRNGAEITDAALYGDPTVLPHQVVEDVLGRFLPLVDKGYSTIDTTATLQLNQMAYEDGATARQILDDLMGLVPSHWWAVWGPQSPGGKPLFQWAPWPSGVGIDGLDSNRDGFSVSGSAADLYNEVSVRYTDPHGVVRTVLRTGDSPALTAAGITRRGMVDLGSQVGSLSQATTAGDAFLAAHRYPSNGGTIEVARPVVDWSTGRRLWPWQIKAGVLARVGNVMPRPDDLNPAPDGATVFRVSDVTYSARSGVATLTLDSYDRTVARALARLSRVASRGRRL